MIQRGLFLCWWWECVETAGSPTDRVHLYAAAFSLGLLFLERWWWWWRREADFTFSSQSYRLRHLERNTVTRKESEI